MPPSEVAQSADFRRPVAGALLLVCRDAMPDPILPSDANVELVDCTDPRQRAMVEAQNDAGQLAPITPGREFFEDALWNAWADTRYVGTSDRRFDLDNDSRGGYLTLGLDRRVDRDLVAGLSVAFESGYSEGFGDSFRIESGGFNIAPYIGYRLSPEWTIDASLGYGRVESDNRIVVLSGNYTTHRYSASLTATGQYAWGEDTGVRPKASVFYSEFHTDAYNLNGIVAGIPVTLQVAEDQFEFGAIELAGELNHVFRGSAGRVMTAFAELAARYEFARPNDGQLLVGNLTLESTSPWSGALRLGARALITPAASLEGSVGYLSVGQQDLDAWEGKVFLSIAF